MAYVPVIHIKINDIDFYSVNAVKITKSLDEISDTAIIKIPTSARLKRESANSDVEVSKVFKQGDKVEILFGYTNYYKEFEGYIKRINYTTPLEIECEDSMYKLRQKSITKSWSKTTLKDIVNFLIAGTGIELIRELPVINFSSFYLKDVNSAFALQKLRDEYGLYIYFVGLKRLYIGFTASSNPVQINYNLGGQRSNVIKPSLKYRLAEEIKLKIKAIHIKKNNARTEIEVGDADGELRTLYFYDIENPSELKKLASQEIEKYKFTGYEGSLLTFGLPIARPGMTSKINDYIYPERSGTYLVKSVETEYGSKGIKRKVEIGMKYE
jgi:hypothetical protein